MLTQIKSDLAESLSPLLELDSSDIIQILETPKNKEFGQLAMPVFRFSKAMKKAPPEIAKSWSELISSKLPHFLLSVSSVSGFINFQFRSSYLQKAIEASVFSHPEDFGFGKQGHGKRVVIDFASPNVAKPMHIGHLRATVVGKAIVNLCRAQGFEVIGVNHLGDWGTQFGKLAWAYNEWGSEYDFESKAFESLYALYVRFHEEAEENPELDKLGAETFLRLEAGDQEIVELWDRFVKISLEQYDRLFSLLNVKHERVIGESFYNDKLKPTVELIKEKGLLKESEGAMVVEMDDPKSPPCLITKSDGASLYATRDVASAIYRHDELKGDKLLYVVGVEQTLHFRQVFEVIKKMGYDWADTCEHISFGRYRFKDAGKMSSRKGKVIAFADVVEKAISMVKEIINEKNPELEHKDKVAIQVGVGAITFNDLMNDRVKNVEFDWDQVLDFEGDSGPYVQYCNVRCLSVLRKAGAEVSGRFSTELETFEERELMRLVLSFEQVLLDAYEHFKPHILATYLLDLCRQFSSFYAKTTVLGEKNQDLRGSRLALVKAVNMTLEKGLGVLNIEAPSFM